MAWWDLDKKTIKITKKEERNLVLFKKFMKLNFYRVKKINEIIAIPEPNQQFRIISQQSFNGFSILLWLLEKDKYQEIYITSFSLDGKTANALVDLIKAMPGVIFTLVITSLLKYDLGGSERFNKLLDCAKNNSNFTFVEAYNHTKIIMAKSKTNHFVVEGSGNLSANARIEQYLFENSAETYNFHKAWIDDIEAFSAKKDTTIHK